MACYPFKLGPLKLVLKHLPPLFANFLGMTLYKSSPLSYPFQDRERGTKGVQKGAFGPVNEGVPFRNPFRRLSYPFVRFGGYERVRKVARKGRGFPSPFRTF